MKNDNDRYQKQLLMDSMWNLIKKRIIEDIYIPEALQLPVFSIDGIIHCPFYRTGNPTKFKQRKLLFF